MKTTPKEQKRIGMITNMVKCMTLHNEGYTNSEIAIKTGLKESSVRGFLGKTKDF